MAEKLDQYAEITHRIRGLIDTFFEEETSAEERRQILKEAEEFPSNFYNALFNLIGWNYEFEIEGEFYTLQFDSNYILNLYKAEFIINLYRGQGADQVLLKQEVDTKKSVLFMKYMLLVDAVKSGMFDVARYCACGELCEKLENETFYNALVKAIERTVENEIYEKVIGCLMDFFDLFGLKDLREYQDGIEYKKIFLRIYYEYLHEISFAYDYEGRCIAHTEDETVVAIFEGIMFRMSGNNDALLRRYKKTDIKDSEYKELIELYSPS